MSSTTSSEKVQVLFIEFDKFKAHGSIPRCPNQLHLCSNISEVELVREESLLIFVSHRWLQSEANQPDDEMNSKFKLIVEGLEKMKASLCPKIKNIFLWCDYSCINQDGEKMGELKSLDYIIRFCDVLFTPIVDDLWESRVYNIGEGWLWAYPADWWRDGTIGYRNRGWCRFEMYLAANEPLLTNSADRIERLRGGLRFFIAEKKVRPHILYGTYHSKTNRAVTILPPLQNDLYERLDPLEETAFITKEDERQLIKNVMGRNPRQTIQVGYEGERNGLGQMHGQGKLTFEDGKVYEGEFQNDLWNGKGKCTYPNGDTFIGDCKMGKFDGSGKCFFSNGDAYEGEYKNGSTDGLGKYFFANGNIYEGEFSNGIMDGRGTFVFNNGDIYVGEFKNGLRDGRGKLTNANGDFYEGEYKKDLRDGRGTYSNRTESFEGEFKNDRKDGSGKLTFAHGDVYEGEFKNGWYHGRGKYISTGYTYEGEFLNGVRHGRGRQAFADGAKYEGEYKNDFPDGWGTFVHRNGDIYEGEYKNNKRDGRGKYTYTTGVIWEGIWKEGNFIH